MVSRESRVIGVALLLAFALAGLYWQLSWQYGVLEDWSQLISFLIFAVVAIALPQAYLARTDETSAARLRHQTVVLVLLLFGSVFSVNATTWEVVGIWSVVVVGIVLVGGHYFMEGYRESQTASR